MRRGISAACVRRRKLWLPLLFPSHVGRAPTECRLSPLCLLCPTLPSFPASKGHGTNSPGRHCKDTRPKRGPQLLSGAGQSMSAARGDDRTWRALTWSPARGEGGIVVRRNHEKLGQTRVRGGVAHVLVCKLACSCKQCFGPAIAVHEGQSSGTWSHSHSRGTARAVRMLPAKKESGARPLPGGHGGRERATPFNAILWPCCAG